MGMIWRYKDGVYVVIMPPTEPAEGEGGAAEGYQPVPEPQPQHMKIEAPLTA